jgi:hypothetical protein
MVHEKLRPVAQGTTGARSEEGTYMPADIRSEVITIFLPEDDTEECA